MCTIGDGAFQMLGMNGLITVKRHWQEWENPTFVVLVLHNDDLNQVSWEMREVGDPRWDTAQLVEDMDYAKYAEVLGLQGIRVEDPEPTWNRRGTKRSPPTGRCVLDVLTDRNVPPLAGTRDLRAGQGCRRGDSPRGSRIPTRGRQQRPRRRLATVRPSGRC